MNDALTGEQIMADVIARPGDDFLRLVYADWLEEHGQSERAAVVRAWRRGGMAFIGNVPHKQKDRGRGNFLPRWVGGGGPRGFTAWARSALPAPWADTRFNGVFRAGVFREVSCPLAWWLKHGPDLVRSHPLLVRVEPSDRLDVCALWFANSDWPPGQVPTGSNGLPWLLASAMDAVCRRYGGRGQANVRTPSQRVWDFASEAAASEALSAALLLWAKEEARARPA